MPETFVSFPCCGSDDGYTNVSMMPRVMEHVLLFRLLRSLFELTAFMMISNSSAIYCYMFCLYVVSTISPFRFCKKEYHRRDRWTVILALFMEKAASA